MPPLNGLPRHLSKIPWILAPRYLSGSPLFAPLTSYMHSIMLGSLCVNFQSQITCFLSLPLLPKCTSFSKPNANAFLPSCNLFSPIELIASSTLNTFIVLISFCIIAAYNSFSTPRSWFLWKKGPFLFLFVSSYLA